MLPLMRPNKAETRVWLLGSVHTRRGFRSSTAPESADLTGIPFGSVCVATGRRSVRLDLSRGEEVAGLRVVGV